MIKKAAARLMAALFLVLMAPAALAAEPEDQPEKGSVPAVSCTVSAEKSSEERPEPVPVSTETLYIGLSFDENALQETTLINTEHRGFRFGYYDVDRRFVALGEIDSFALTIRRERNWYVLMDEVFPTQDEAQTYTRSHLGRVITLAGESRVAVGPLASRGEADYTIRRYALAGSAWAEPCIALYDPAGRLQYLHTGTEQLALQPITDAKSVTEYAGRRYYGDFLLVPWDDERFTVINAVGLEDYVKGVVPYEMNASWPMEALKAQAVCARTYAVYNLNAYTEDYGFDLTNDVYCQVYRGINAADAVTDEAVDTTAGLFVRYGGEICEIYYFSSDGGATEDGGRIFGSDRPYLAGKTDPFEAAMDRMVLRWERRFSGEEITRRLNENGYEIGKVVRIEPVFSELGNAVGMRYYDEAGECLALEQRESYRPLALESCRFTLDIDEEAFVFSGIGWGHGCGMSQWGAYAMADTYGMTADDIIEFYFTGAYIG